MPLLFEIFMLPVFAATPSRRAALSIFTPSLSLFLFRRGFFSPYYAIIIRRRYRHYFAALILRCRQSAITPFRFRLRYMFILIIRRR